MSTFTVRPLRIEDLSAVAQLERLCFPDEPWSEASLLALCRDFGAGMVATEADGTISAYVGMTYAVGEGSITNVATHPNYRTGGRGRAVVTALLTAARELCLDALFLEVRPSNAVAIRLYEGAGFTVVGKRKNFYRHPTEDALIMKAEPSRAARES